METSRRERNVSRVEHRETRESEQRDAETEEGSERVQSGPSLFEHIEAQTVAEEAKDGFGGAPSDADESQSDVSFTCELISADGDCNLIRD